MLRSTRREEARTGVETGVVSNNLRVYLFLNSCHTVPDTEYVYRQGGSPVENFIHDQGSDFCGIAQKSK